MIDKEKTNKSDESITIIQNPTPQGDFPPVAGMLKRLGALLVDIVLMMGVGQLLGLAFAAPLSELGPYGRLLGLLIVIPYFGIMNSNLCNGQTIGKRLMKIAVRDAENLPISITRSVLRILILATPFFLYGLAIPQLNTNFMSLVLSILIFGLGGIIAFTLLLNREAKQSFHDMLLKTWVVDLKEKNKAQMPATGKHIWVIAAIWGGMTIVFFSFLLLINPNPESTIPYDALRDFNKVVGAQPGVLTSSVVGQTINVEESEPVNTLFVSLWLKGQRSQSEYEQEALKTAAFILQNFDQLDAFDSIQIGVLSGYDIAIAGKTSFYSQLNTIEEWQGLVTAN